MKFLVSKELKQNVLLRQVVLFLVVLFGFFLLTDLVLYHFQIGLNLEKATETLMGNEEAFIEPILFDVLLERVHIGIFTAMMTLVLLSIIYMRVHNIKKSNIIHLAFISAIFSSLTLLLAYVYGAVFIFLWITFFVIWHLCGLYLAFSIARSLLKK